MVILGIDPGTATIGYGVIRVYSRKSKKRTGRFKCLKFGCIRTNPDDDFPKRLIVLQQEIRKLVKSYRPRLVIIETLFFFQNKKTAIKVSEATGVIILTLERMHIPMIECSPLQVKKFLTKNGRADKEEVRRMVKKVLKIKDPHMKDDAADALALALYAANQI